MKTERFRRAWLLGVVAAACATTTTPPVEVREAASLPKNFVEAPRRITVVPAMVPGEATSIGTSAVEQITRRLEAAVAAQMAWEVVMPDDVEAMVETAAEQTTAARRVGAFAADAGADAGLGAVIRRYRERKGAAYGAVEPASVWLELLLVPAGGKAPVWVATYDVTQEPVAYNLFNLWGLARGGPRWFTAEELAGIGIGEAVSRLPGVRASRPMAEAGGSR